MTINETINAQVKSIVEDFKALPETLKKIDVADLQKQAQELAQTALGTATAAYADFAKKSEELVAKAKGLKVDDIKKTVDSSVEDVTKQAKGFADDAQKRAEGLVADAKATVTKVTGKKPAKKASAKKPAAKKTAAKKAPAKKTAAKKA
jgi:heparin binding hemagglutinin HbhA